MMGSYEHEMMDEVREARRALTRARLAESEAHAAFREARTERATKERALEEILDSIATGDTGRGLLDLADRNRQARETADERQRGATAVERPKVRKAKLQGAARVPTATVEAPDEAERVGCKPRRPMTPTVDLAGRIPSPVVGDLSEFASALMRSSGGATADAEDHSAMWSRPWLHSTKLWVAGEDVEVEIGYKPEYHGGSLRFGAPLDAAGYAHYGVGRLVDGVPVDLPEYYRSRPYEYAERLAYHLARLTTRPGDAKPSDAEDAPAWRSTPLAALAIPEASKAALRRCGVWSAGDLADAIDLGSDDCRTDVNTEAIVVPDGPWAAVIAAVDELRAPRPFEPVTADPSGKLTEAEADALEEELERQAAAEWADTPLNMVVIRGDLLDWLTAMDLHTLGDLADACKWCGSLKHALDDWTPENTAEVERDVRTWTSRRPGFPLDVLTLPPADPDRYWPVMPLGSGEVLGIVKAADESTAFLAAERRFPHRLPVVVGEPSDSPPPGGSEEIEDALKAALYPPGIDPGWSDRRAEGMSDHDVLATLRSIWPGSATPIKDAGCTVIGFLKPRFWARVLAPGENPPPDLEGAELCRAVRLVLRIPNWGDVERPAAAAKPEKPRKASRKKAAAAGAGS